jgi:hypothetical protein
MLHFFVTILKITLGWGEIGVVATRSDWTGDCVCEHNPVQAEPCQPKLLPGGFG